MKTLNHWKESDRETFIEERVRELLSLGESWDSEGARKEAEQEWETEQSYRELATVVEPCRKCLIEHDVNIDPSRPEKCLKPATHIWTPVVGAETPLCEMHAARLSKLPSIADTIKPIGEYPLTTSNPPTL